MQPVVGLVNSQTSQSVDIMLSVSIDLSVECFLQIMSHRFTRVKIADWRTQLVGWVTHMTVQVQAGAMWNGTADVWVSGGLNSWFCTLYSWVEWSDTSWFAYRNQPDRLTSDLYQTTTLPHKTISSKITTVNYSVK